MRPDKLSDYSLFLQRVVILHLGDTAVIMIATLLVTCFAARVCIISMLCLASAGKGFQAQCTMLILV